MNLTDGQVHDLELYFLDWDQQGRTEQIQISDASTGAVLNTADDLGVPVGGVPGLAVSGNILITITKQAGTSNVLSGLFLDPAPRQAGHVPDAGHGDARELDRGPTAARATTIDGPVQPPALRQRSPPSGANDVHLGGVHDRHPRPADLGRLEPDRGDLVDDDELHRRREPHRRPGARPGAVLPRLGPAGPDRAGPGHQCEHRCRAEHADDLGVPVGGVPATTR